MASGEVQLVVKAGPFGEGSGGHSHSDVLSLTARVGCREILIDPGTFTYVADPAERNRFRGSAAHNTVRIDGRDQAVPAVPSGGTISRRSRCASGPRGPERDYLDASCAYAGFTHRRRVVFREAGHGVRSGYGRMARQAITGWSSSGILDSAEDAARFSFSAPAEVVDAWRSRALVQQGTRQRALRQAAGSAACSYGGSAGSLGVSREQPGGDSDGGGRDCGGTSAGPVPLCGFPRRG